MLDGSQICYSPAAAFALTVLLVAVGAGGGLLIASAFNRRKIEGLEREILPLRNQLQGEIARLQAFGDKPSAWPPPPIPTPFSVHRLP